MRTHPSPLRLYVLSLGVALLGSVSLLTAAPVAEFGSAQEFQYSATQWNAVTFSETHATPPVVIMGPLSSRGVHPTTVRVRNVTATGFEWQMDEYDYLDGAHTRETISWIALEPGVHAIGGLVLEAGRMTAGRDLTSTIFAGTHPEIPVVLSQVETAANLVAPDDTVALVPRVQNITTAGFSIELQDQELSTGPIAIESVGYVAITPGQGYLNGRPFSVLRTGTELTHEDLTVPFGGLAGNPLVYAGQQTMNGSDVATIRYRSTTDTSVDLWLEEEGSGDNETTHAAEVAGLLVIGDTYTQTESKLELLEISVTGNWQSVDLPHVYNNPVIVAGPPTYAGADPGNIRVRNVTENDFEVQFDEWDYRDGGHATETISVIVMEAGSFEIGGLTWQAAAHTGVTHEDSTATFAEAFDATPVLLTQVATMNEPEALAHQIRNLGSAGFDVRVLEEKANDQLHGEETLHYIAIEPGSGVLGSGSGVLFSAAVTGNTVDHEDELIAFGANFAAPRFIAHFQTTNGGDPSSLRVKALTAGSATVFLEEEDSTLDGITHTNEVVGYLIASTVLDTDGDGIGDDYENGHPGLDPNDPNDAGLDLDGDLLTNLEEFEAGYDPNSFDGGQITLQTLEDEAYEIDGTPARFRINRSVGRAEVTVNFTVDGGADPEAAASSSDYTVATSTGTALSGAITVPENASSVEIHVTPTGDATIEYPENLRIALVTSADYNAGGSSQLATIAEAQDTEENEQLYYGQYAAEAWAAGQTSASGYATLVINGSNTRATVKSVFSGLTTTQTVSHIHHSNGSATQAGPIVTGLPSGQVEDEIWDIVPTGAYSGQDLIDALNKVESNQFLYANVHSTQFPAGEIRSVFTLYEGGTFEEPDPAPAITPLSGDDLTREVSRFLTQATFGPTQAEIEALVTVIEDNHGGDRMAGFAAWMDAQFALDQTNLYDYTYYADQFEWDLRESEPVYYDNSNDPDHNNRRRGWWTLAVGAHDQLRQRVGFALSEILVISERENNVRTRHYGAAKYYDDLLAAADGNYRDLLEYVSKSPMMGAYLSSLKNQKAVIDSQTGDVIVAPDENYAREIMQLFSIGLVNLNPDGTLAVDFDGLPVQTYTNEDITELARVFTGWSFSRRHGSQANGYPEEDNPNFNQYNGPKYFQASWLNPMKNFSAYHDTGEKSFLGGTVPSGLNGEQDLDAALDIIHGHANVAPFIARRMIQRLTHSNPSRGYIYRVAQAFETGTFDGSGSGQRGDIGAMVRAILLDYEARTLAVAEDISYGKQKEPIIRYVQLLRALGGRTLLPLADFAPFGYPATQLDNFPDGQTVFRYYDTTTNLSQSPLAAPTVFNWFLPDYEPGGDISVAGLVAPEMIQATETQVIYTMNFMNNLSRYNTQGVQSRVGQTDSDLDNIRIDRDGLTALYDDARDGGATAVEAATLVVDHLDMLLMAGNFKATYGAAAEPNPRSIIIDTVSRQGNYWRIRDAIYLMIATPEYIHQK